MKYTNSTQNANSFSLTALNGATHLKNYLRSYVFTTSAS